VSLFSGVAWSVSTAALAIVLTTCATGAPNGHQNVTLDTDVLVRAHPLTLHLSLTPQHPTDPLIVYATGDGGWWGDDKAIFDELVAWGYPVAGFSARDYVKHLGDGVSAISVSEMAVDFAAVIRAAKAALNLPAVTRVVLVGKSRGAGLDVAVASQEPVKSRLRGVIAIALTREEEYASIPSPKDGKPTMLLTYPALPPIGDVPVAVIQSTKDDYIPAAEARDLFGPDTASRTLRPVESSGHNFEGGVPALYREMTKCFEWILHQ
jgi:pimeloyl-ACP methyl ester carboxylesterase